MGEMTGDYLKRELVNMPNASLLDIGAGDGRLYKNYISTLGTDIIKDISIYELDYGLSYDAANSTKNTSVVRIDGKFLEVNINRTFDVCVASHFIEHQNNIGLTLDKIFTLTTDGGLILIEWPLPHRLMFGGHVTALTPGMILYNIAKLGFSTKFSEIKISGFFALLIIKKIPKISELNHLKWDTGELKQLDQMGLLPDWLYEDSNSYPKIPFKSDD
jgi:SAM-dependent methyltransferase